MKSMKIDLPKSLAQMVATRLRKAIIDGEIGLGENIAEEKLAESFGVSRTPVRDALIQLEQQGLVTIRPKRGSFVFMPTAEDVAMICEYRKMIEVKAMQLAVAHDKETLLTRLNHVVNDMDRAMHGNDSVGYGQLDTDFHQAFVDCARNRYVTDAYALVSGQVAALRTHLTRPIERLRELSFDEHKMFVDYVRAGDFSAFQSLMDVHVDRTGEVYMTALSDSADERIEIHG